MGTCLNCLRAKTKIVVTRYNHLTEGVLTCTHNLCFEQKYENNQKISIENCHFTAVKKDPRPGRCVCFLEQETFTPQKYW